MLKNLNHHTGGKNGWRRTILKKTFFQKIIFLNEKLGDFSTTQVIYTYFTNLNRFLHYHYILYLPFLLQTLLSAYSSKYDTRDIYISSHLLCL